MSSEVDFERGTVRLGWKTLISVALFLVAATVGGVTTWGQMASKEEVKAYLAELRKQALKADKEANRARITAEQNAMRLQKMDALKSRVDFLVEVQLERASSNKHVRRAVDAASEKIRARAKLNGEPDPLSGMRLDPPK